MHAVHTRTCLLTPATTARTRFRFGFHRRLRVLFAWLTTFPYCGPLPHSAHFIAIVFLLVLNVQPKFLPQKDICQSKLF